MVSKPRIPCGTGGVFGPLSAADGSFNKGEMTDTQLAELNRHLEKMQEIEAGSGNHPSNKSMSRYAEVASSDAYVRRMFLHSGISLP